MTLPVPRLYRLYDYNVTHLGLRYLRYRTSYVVTLRFWFIRFTHTLTTFYRLPDLRCDVTHYTTVILTLPPHGLFALPFVRLDCYHIVVAVGYGPWTGFYRFAYHEHLARLPLRFTTRVHSRTTLPLFTLDSHSDVAPTPVGRCSLFPHLLVPSYVGRTYTYPLPPFPTHTTFGLIPSRLWFCSH